MVKTDGLPPAMQMEILQEFFEICLVFVFLLSEVGEGVAEDGTA